MPPGGSNPSSSQSWHRLKPPSQNKKRSKDKTNNTSDLLSLRLHICGLCSNFRHMDVSKLETFKTKRAPQSGPTLIKRQSFLHGHVQKVDFKSFWFY